MIKSLVSALDDSVAEEVCTNLIAVLESPYTGPIKAELE